MKEAESILEQKEWTNLWWEAAPDHSKPRVLLIGDSITNGYQPAVNLALREEVYANAWASSKALDHRWYLDELEFVWRQNDYDYRLIHFNNGLHGWHLGIDAYERLYENTVKYMMEKHPSAKLTLALSTPVCVSGSLTELDPHHNAEVMKRNEAVCGIAAKYGLPVNDLYTPMIGKKEFRQEDGYHYNAAGIAYQGQIVAEFIRTHLFG